MIELILMALVIGIIVGWVISRIGQDSAMVNQETCIHGYEDWLDCPVCGQLIEL